VRATAALAITLLLVLAGAAVALSVERPRLAGTNNVFDRFPNVPIGPGTQACAQAELVPGGSASVRVHAQPAPEAAGPPFRLELRSGGRLLAAGERAGGWKEGTIDVPVRPTVGRIQPRTDLCFTNEGSVAMTLWGYGASDERRTEVNGQPVRERIRLTYLRAGEESGWEIAGEVADRMGIGRGTWLDGWVFPGWVAALAGMLAATVAAVVRGRRT
jgi:hypothetical protein